MRRHVAFVGLVIVLLAAASPAVSAGPEDPDANFCPGHPATLVELSTDAAAGVLYSSSIATALGSADKRIGVYVENLGPGPITFLEPDPWSVGGTALGIGTIQLTPKRESASFWDRGWAGTFAEGFKKLGCIELAATGRATAHLDLTFVRDDTGTQHTVRVNVHFRP